MLYGGFLFQPNNQGQPKPVGYVSRSLSDADKYYSITEKEALGLVWIDKLHIYLFYQRFGVIVD